MKFEDFLIMLGMNARQIKITGWTLILAPSVWDFLWYGFNKFQEWRVAVIGILVMWIGAVLIGISSNISKRLGGE